MKKNSTPEEGEAILDAMFGDLQDEILYQDMIYAFFYTFNYLLGNGDDGPITALELKSEMYPLYATFIVAGIYIILILANMIIAIMSDV